MQCKNQLDEKTYELPSLVVLNKPLAYCYNLSLTEIIGLDWADYIFGKNTANINKKICKEIEVNNQEYTDMYKHQHSPLIAEKAALRSDLQIQNDIYNC